LDILGDNYHEKRQKAISNMFADGLQETLVDAYFNHGIYYKFKILPVKFDLSRILFICLFVGTPAVRNEIKYFLDMFCFFNGKQQLYIFCAITCYSPSNPMNSTLQI